MVVGVSDTVIVLGASGGIGGGIVAGLLAADYTVVAVGRNRQKLSSLAAGLGHDPRLELVAGSVATDGDAAALTERLRPIAGSPLAVVTSLGGRSASARLLDQPASFLRNTMEEDLVSHFIAGRHLLPLLAGPERDSLYLSLSGPAAECAWAGYGHRSVAAAALRMLTLVMREEAKDLPVRIQQLQICSPVRTGRNGSCECPEWLEPEDVGRKVVELVAGTRGGESVVRIGGYPQPVETDNARTTNVERPS